MKYKNGDRMVINENYPHKEYHGQEVVIREVGDKYYSTELGPLLLESEMDPVNPVEGPAELIDKALVSLQNEPFDPWLAQVVACLGATKAALGMRE